MAFVLSAFSWAADIRLSFFRFSSPTFSHYHLLWSCIPSVFLRNWPYNTFSFLPACLSFSWFSLFFPSIFVLSCNSSVAVFRRFSFCLQHNQRGYIFLAFCKSRFSPSPQTSHTPHPTSQTFHSTNMSHPEYSPFQTSHISNISHPEHPTSPASYITNIPHTQHPTSSTP